jgi:hypothetical protein
LSLEEEAEIGGDEEVAGKGSSRLEGIDSLISSC